MINQYSVLGLGKSTGNKGWERRERHKYCVPSFETLWAQLGNISQTLAIFQTKTVSVIIFKRAVKETPAIFPCKPKSTKRYTEQDKIVYLVQTMSSGSLNY